MGDCSTRKDDLKCTVSEESAELKEKPWQLFLRMRGGLEGLAKGNCSFQQAWISQVQKQLSFGIFSNTECLIGRAAV